MKFTTLQIHNFLTIQDAQLNLDDRGLQLIQGVNNEDESASSNGAGKSSIVDAICWSLFGTTARDVSGDSVVNLKASKDCFVEIVIVNGAQSYVVTRYRKHATFKNSLQLKTPEGLSLTKGTDKETQKEVEKILGCSLEVFMAAVYSGQEVMPDLPKMKDRELKTLIEEAAGLQRIEQAYALARERFSAASKVVAVLVTNKERTEENIVSNDSALALRLGKQEEWNEGREVVIASGEARVVAALISASDLMASIMLLKPAADSAKTRLVEIDASMVEHASRMGTLREAEKLSALHERQYYQALRTFTEARGKVEQIEIQIANAATELGKPCTECGTPGSLDNMGEWVGHKTAHRVTLDAERLAHEKTAKDLSEKWKTVLATVAAAIALVPDVKALTVEAASLRLVLSEYDAQIVTARRLVMDKKAAETDLATRRSMVNPEDAVVEELNARGSVNALALVTNTEKLADAEKAQAIAKSVVDVFGPSGVRAQILDTVTPYLNSRTSDYLSILTDGNATAVWTTLTKMASGDLKEKFSIDVTHSKGGDSFAALSGGEKRKVRLACALALQDLVASRATQPIQIFIGDEIDDALDPAGLERLMVILERKARERGTVLIVSHNSLSDWVDSVTTVTKEAQWTSNVSGALCV